MSDGGRLLSTEGAIVPKKLPECSREYRRPWRLSRLELVKSALGGVSLSALLGGKAAWRMTWHRHNARCTVPKAGLALLRAWVAAGWQEVGGPWRSEVGPVFIVYKQAANGREARRHTSCQAHTPARCDGGERQAVAVCLSCGRVRRCHLRLWPGVRSLRERFALVHRVRQEGVPTWHAAHAVQHMRGKEPVRIVQGVRREYAQAARKPS